MGCGFLGISSQQCLDVHWKYWSIPAEKGVNIFIWELALFDGGQSHQGERDHVRICAEKE